MPQSAEYDVITVGGGLGGLSAAACLARTGRRVLLAERQDGVGGNAHVFRRGPYTFDPAVHVTAHGYNIPVFDLYFEALGVRDDIELIPSETFFAVHICGELYQLPIGTQALIEALEGYFPDKGARQFIEASAQTTRESQQTPPRIGLKDLDQLREALPMLFKYRNATLGDVLDEHIDDERVKAVCAGQWPYYGLPPSRLSFMAYSGAFMAFCDPGPQYVRGSFQKLADTVAASIEASGGEVLVDTEVTRILVENGRVGGVELGGSEVVRAPVVISNADARLTFFDLIGEEHLPARYVRRLRRMRPSISGFLLYSAARIDPTEFGLDHETTVFRHWDHDRSYDDVLAARLGGTWLSFPTMHDPGLAPEGEHIVIFTSLMPYDIGESWESAKGRITERMIDWVEELMPGYRDAITFAEAATPRAFERHTLAQQGAIYGWANDPAQTAPKRLDAQTPIEGLWLAGHWTNPGPGSVRCLLSGAQTAASIAERDNAIALLHELARR